MNEWPLPKRIAAGIILFAAVGFLAILLSISSGNPSGRPRTAEDLEQGSSVVIYFVLAALLYFLPALIGHKKRNAAGIAALNLFLGWTVIGWIIALIWACCEDPPLPAATGAPALSAVGSNGVVCQVCTLVNLPAANFCSRCGTGITAISKENLIQRTGW